MRFVLTLLLTTLVLSAFAQRTLHRGRVVNATNDGVPGVHVRNETIGKITVSDYTGLFALPLKAGDTLLLTSIGYAPHSVIVQAEWLTKPFLLTLTEASVQLEEVTIHSILPIEHFKELIVETQIKDTVQFWYFGMPTPVFTGDKMLAGTIHKKVLYAISQPTSFLYYNFSKAEKEKRKFYQIEQNQQATEQAENKFTREWVAEHTGLEGDTLTSFIYFCNFPIHFINSASEYIILEEMMVKLEIFKNLKKK